MAKLKQKFDSAEYDDPEAYALLPKAEYMMYIAEDSLTRNNNDDGDNLTLIFQMCEGEGDENVKIFHNLCIEHHKQEVEERANRELSSIIRACFGEDRDIDDDTENLWNIPILCKVGIQKGSNGYDDKNVIKQWTHVEGAEPISKKDKKKKNKKDEKVKDKSKDKKSKDKSKPKKEKEKPKKEKKDKGNKSDKGKKGKSKKFSAKD